MNFARWSVLLAVFAAFAFALPGTAFADTTALAGTYEFDEENSDDMMEAFTPAIDAMSRLRRGFARRAVRAEDNPAAQIRLDVSADEITIRQGAEPALTAPLNGETVGYTNKDDEPERVTARIKGDAIEVHRDFEDGEYRTTYRLRSNGDTLMIQSKIDMDALPKVVDYNRVYHRQ